MGADLSRIRSNPLLDFAGVELKQGGVVLDADINDFVAVVDRRLRAAASDILGRSTVSSTTPDAFKITAIAGALAIGKGRLYVDGLLAENHGAVSTDPAKKLFDPLMAEANFADPIAYSAQPYLPSPPALPTAGRHLVYLDAWEREVTHLERPDLVEPAVGVETSSRKQTVWQVRVLEPDAASATCGSPDEDVAGWSPLTAPSTGRLTTGTFDVPPEKDPCELPPSGGYRGLENQTYRVEIHDPGQPGGTATFKWSRENASVGSRVASMVSATELELQTLGRDDVLRFNSGDWVEITDDVRELSQRCGEVRLITVNEATRRLTFTPALPAEMVPAAFPSSDFPRDRNLRVRRWDHKHEVLRTGPGGTTQVFQDLDAGTTGVINVPAAGTTLLLENGVTVSFASTGAKGLRAGDYWVFAARTADASVELLANEPPRGIHHHYARLGIWDVAADTVTDCRTPWPPRGEGHDCSCTECVTPQSHASGQFTIQAAVDRVRDTGGTVCLGVGQFQLKEPVVLNGARAVRIRGQGAATLVVTPGGAFSIGSGIALAIEDLAILSLGKQSAISVHTVAGLALRKLVIAMLGGDDARGAAIALAGAVIGATIRDNVIIAPVAVQATDPAAAPIPGIVVPPPQMLLSAALRIEDNVLWCERQAVALAGQVIHVLATRITGNEVLGCRQGAITALGLCVPGASMYIAGNSLNVNGPGITAGVDGLWIEGNKLVVTPQRADQRPDGAGITLRTGLDPSGSTQCHVLANQVSGFPDAGILIQAPAEELLVKLNIIEGCGNGILMLQEAKGGAVSIENNHLRNIGSDQAEPRLGLFSIGIGLSRTDSANIAGNSIRQVGVNATAGQQVLAGILGFGVLRSRIYGNEVSEIGPLTDFGGTVGGILMLAPYAQLEIAHNHVERDAQPVFAASTTPWQALSVEEPNVEAGPTVVRTGNYTAVRVADRTLVIANDRAYVSAVAVAVDAATGAQTVLGASVTVLGNTLIARGREPTVDVVASGDLMFSNNRCELRANDSIDAVRLAANTAIVNANRVRGGEVSMQLVVDAQRLTVVGNITTNPIVAPGLPAVWEPLNIRA